MTVRPRVRGKPTPTEAAAELSFTEEKLRACAVLGDGESGGNGEDGERLRDGLYVQL